MIRRAMALSLALALGALLTLAVVSGCGSNVAPSRGDSSSAAQIPLDTPSGGWYTNLLRNPGAEAGPGGTGGDVASIPGWTKHAHATVVLYGTAGFPGPLTPGPTGRGQKFFYGGHVQTGTPSVLDQFADVSWAATQIDSKLTRYTISAWIGGKGAQADSARITLRFVDAGVSTLGEVNLAPVTAAERGNATRFILRSRTGGVPSYTRYLWVFVKFLPGQDADIHGFVDNLSLSLSPPPPT